MFKEKGLESKPSSIALQPWLWTAGVICLIALTLAGQAGRYLWKDSIRVEGKVRHFESSEPLRGVYVEVVWEELRKDLSKRRLHREVVRTDENGVYQAALPDSIAEQVSNQPVRGSVPLRVHGYTARVYKPGYRHIRSSMLFHQRLGYIPTGWNEWAGAGFTIELEEPNERDRSGDVRLMPTIGSDQQRIRQLYGTLVALGAAPARQLDRAEQDWLNAMCREADGLMLERDVELQMREDICNPKQFDTKVLDSAEGSRRAVAAIAGS